MKMKLAKTQKLLLFVAGALLILIGTFISASPIDFYASNSIDLGPNVSLLNELKAPAGFLLVAGLFIIGATFIQHLADSAMLLAAMIYLSYAASRFASMVFDGVPAAGLVQAAALETIIGLACLAVLLIRRVPARKVA
jgi:hypothetical protein